MVLFCVTGELGTGKTLSATFLGWKNWFFRGRKIYSNYHLFKIPYIYVNSINKLNEMKEGFVLADELWTICVSPDSMVLCNDNNKEIKDINYLDTVYSCDINNFKLVKNEVSDIQIVKNDTGYLVKTKNYKLKCTKEHPFFVYSNGKIIQKRAEELNINDWVLVIKNLDEPTESLIDEKNKLPLGETLKKGIEKLCRYENKQKIGYLRKSFSLNITEGVLSKIINYLKGYESFNKCEELIFIDKLLNSNFTLQKVKKKEIIKLPIAYDITVPNTSNFIAEGFVVHNCDSRLSGSKKTRFASSILLRSRKRILEYVFTSQIVDLLDKRVRKVLDFIAYPILNVNETICKLLIFRGNKVKPQTYLKTIYFKTQGVYELYDTNEEIDMDDEDKKADIIVFQENYNPKHGYFCECDECNTKFFNTWKEANDYAEKWWMKHKNYVYTIL